MGASSKKRLTAANRRLRERSRLSFLFVIFFFGLFSLIIVMETLMDDNDKRMFKEDDFLFDGYGRDEYSNWDISYEEVPLLGKTLPKPEVVVVDAPLARNGRRISQDSPKTKTTIKEEATAAPGKSCTSDWQTVQGSKEKFVVYSAYHVSTFSHVRIIGATRTKSKQNVSCRFYDENRHPFAVVNGAIRTIRENWNLKFSAVFITCYLTDSRRPRFVSVEPQKSSSLTSAKSNSSNLLCIQYPREKLTALMDFAVCVKPIHFSYDNILPFLEWLEFHRLMGVRRFTFYNHTIGDMVNCAIEQYAQLPDIEIEVLPWSLPFISQKEIRTEGIFAALNDCVYRHRGRTKYLVVVDFDEMIVPRKLNNYSMLIDKLDTLSSRKKIGAYSFQNAFFYLQWPDDKSTFKIPENPLAEKVSRKLLSLRKTRRRSRLHPQKQRSKYICDPEKVVEAGNHFIWEMAAAHFTLSVPPHLGSLHHYRVCEFGGDTCIKSPFIVDNSSHQFGQQLSINVASRLTSMSTKCALDIDRTLNSQPFQTGVNSVHNVLRSG